MMTVSVTRKSRIPTVIKKLDRARISILYGQAGYLRKVARNSIKSAKKRSKRNPQGQVSKPGGTPLNHRGKAGIRRTISFKVDRVRGFAVVGYEKGKQPAIAKALEVGGATRWVQKKRSGTGRIKARPVMKPGLRASLQKFRKIRTEEFRKALR